MLEAELPRAAGAGLDILDAVVGDQRAVVADRRPQDLDAVVVGTPDRVARDDQPLGVERYDRGRSDVGEDIAADVAGNLLEPDAVAAAVADFTTADADIAAAQAMDQAIPRRQRHIRAVERKARKADMVGAFIE